MTLITRRDAVTLAAGAIAGAAVPGCGHAAIAVADVPPPRYEIERGNKAQLPTSHSPLLTPPNLLRRIDHAVCAQPLG